MVQNEENELNFDLPAEGMFNGNFNNNIELSNGKIVNGQLMKAPRGITPTMPLRILIKKRNGADFKFAGIFHQFSENNYTPIPQQH